MKRILITLLLFVTNNAFSQAVLSQWQFNVSGQKATYYANTNSGGGAPVYVFTTSPDSADILSICYNSSYSYVTCDGLTTNMGKYLNPGYCYAQNYLFAFPRVPTVPTTKTISPKGGAIGLLVNGVPLFGLGSGTSYRTSTNTNTQTGAGVWNTEVYKAEGFTLDTAFAAHPQQAGAYHSHAAPYRLYKNTATTIHSPLVGFAFDGNPVYGPYGYSSPLDATSAVTRMTTGYSLRNITTRTTLPYGVTASQTGPAVSATFPIGTYCEDYEWLASNNGTLDKYNGRFCVTPEYPSGTYAYFATISAAGVPQFPYLVGIEYYGEPLAANFGPVSTVTIPTSGVTCVYAASTVYLLPLELISFKGVAQKDRNQITWETATERNVNYFSLERSFNGIDFTKIGQIKSKGDSRTTQKHVFYDENPLPKAYYRLVSVENDGREDKSNVISITNEMEAAMRAFHNPTDDKVFLHSPITLDEATLKVCDITGKVLLQNKISIESNTNFEIDITAFASGVYFLHINNQQVQQSIKIIKRN